MHWHGNKLLCNLWNWDSHDLFTNPFRNLHTRNHTEHLNGFFQIDRLWHNIQTCDQPLCHLWNQDSRNTYTNPLRSLHTAPVPASPRLAPRFTSLTPWCRPSFMMRDTGTICSPKLRNGISTDLFNHAVWIAFLCHPFDHFHNLRHDSVFDAVHQPRPHRLCGGSSPAPIFNLATAWNPWRVNARVSACRARRNVFRWHATLELSLLPTLPRRHATLVLSLLPVLGLATTSDKPKVFSATWSRPTHSWRKTRRQELTHKQASCTQHLYTAPGGGWPSRTLSTQKPKPHRLLPRCGAGRIRSWVDILGRLTSCSISPICAYKLFRNALLTHPVGYFNKLLCTRCGANQTGNSTSFLSVHRQVSHRCFSFLSPVSQPEVTALGLTTFASKARALAIDFEVIGNKASIFLVSKWSCGTVSTGPANSHASSRRPRTKNTPSSSSTQWPQCPTQQGSPWAAVCCAPILPVHVPCRIRHTDRKVVCTRKEAYHRCFWVHTVEQFLQFAPERQTEGCVMKPIKLDRLSSWCFWTCCAFFGMRVFLLLDCVPSVRCLCNFLKDRKEVVHVSSKKVGRRCLASEWVVSSRFDRGPFRGRRCRSVALVFSFPLFVSGPSTGDGCFVSSWTTSLRLKAYQNKITHYKSGWVCSLN